MNDDSVHFTYNVPHVGPFRVIEMNEAWVTLDIPLYSWFYYLLLSPGHLRLGMERTVRATPFSMEAHTYTLISKPLFVKSRTFISQK